MASKLLIVDDDILLQHALGRVLGATVRYEVVGGAPDGRTAVRLSQSLQPDIVLMDVFLPELNGIEATRQIRADAPRVRVVCMSAWTREDFVTRALEAGATGFIPKSCGVDELVAALDAVVSGRTYFAEVVTHLVVDRLAGRTPPRSADRLAQLTPREREVLQLVAEGNRSTETATKLFISPRTVESHRAALMEKLQVRTVAGLVAIALEEGITLSKFALGGPREFRVADTATR